MSDLNVFFYYVSLFELLLMPEFLLAPSKTFLYLMGVLLVSLTLSSNFLSTNNLDGVLDIVSFTLLFSAGFCKYVPLDDVLSVPPLLALLLLKGLVSSDGFLISVGLEGNLLIGLKCVVLRRLVVRLLVCSNLRKTLEHEPLKNGIFELSSTFNSLLFA